MKQFVFATMISAAIMLPVYAQSTTPETPHGEVGGRQELQQKRVKAGVKSGDLSKQQGSKLEGEQKQLHSDVKQARSNNGGKLTAGQKAKANKAENKVNRQIHEAKHN